MEFNAERADGLYRAKRHKGHRRDAYCYALLDIPPLPDTQQCNRF
jgi:hypothetical protein